MKRNTSLIVTLAMVALVGLASLAIAGQGQYGNGKGDCMGSGNCGRGMGYGAGQIDQLTPEKQEAYHKIMDAFRAKAEPLRESMWQKRMELKALSPNPNTQPAEIKALVKEIGALHIQMKNERQALRDRLEKEIGLKLGKGMGMRGQHKGMMGGKSMMGGKGMMNGTGAGCPNAQ